MAVGGRSNCFVIRCYSIMLCNCMLFFLLLTEQNVQLQLQWPRLWINLRYRKRVFSVWQRGKGQWPNHVWTLYWLLRNIAQSWSPQAYGELIDAQYVDFSARLQRYVWSYKFSQLKGSSDDGCNKLKLHFALGNEAAAAIESRVRIGVAWETGRPRTHVLTGDARVRSILYGFAACGCASDKIIRVNFQQTFNVIITSCMRPEI